MKKTALSLISALYCAAIIAQTAPDLKDAARFDLLSGTSATSTDSVTVKGDIGALDSVSAEMNSEGTVFSEQKCIVYKALDALDTAKQDASTQAATPISKDIGDTTLTGGVYSIDSSATIKDTLRLSGDSSSVFILNFEQNLTVERNAQILLDSAVKAENVFYNVAGTTVIEDSVNISGVVMCSNSITCSEAVSGESKLLSMDSVKLISVDSLGMVKERIFTTADIRLGRAETFALLAVNGITSSGPILCVGNAGSMKGAVDSNVFATGTVFPPNSCQVQEAISDVESVYRAVTGLQSTAVSGSLGGQILGEGVYKIAGTARLSGALELRGDTASIYVFIIEDTLAVDSGAVLALGDVRPENVYWVMLHSYVAIGKNTNFSGVVLTRGNIVSYSPNTGSLALLSTNGSIALLNNSAGEQVYLYSQKQMLKLAAPNTIVTAVADVTVCGDTVEFSIDIYVSKGQKGITVIVDLPDGVEYVPGTGGTSAYTLTDNTISPGNPVFKIRNTNPPCPPPPALCPPLGLVGPDSTITVTYSVLAACGAVANDSAVAFTSVIYGLTDTLDTSNVLTIYTPYISIPQTNGIVPELLQGNVGDTLCRKIIIKNTGNATLNSTITVVETYGPSIEIVSLSLDSVSLPVDTAGNNLMIEIPVTMLPDSGLLPGEFVVIEECVRITACTKSQSGNSLGASTFHYHWECNSSVCQEDSVAANVKVPSSNQISLSFGPSDPFINTDACYGPDNSSGTQLAITNNGLAPALNFTLELTAGSNSAIADLDFTFINANGVADSSFAPAVYSYLDTSIQPFCTSSAIGLARFVLGDIGPLETVVLQWNTVTCCPQDTVCGGANSRSLGYRLLYQDQCGSDTDTIISPPRYTGPQKVFSHTSFSDVSYLSGPVQLMGDSSFGSVDTGDYAFINTENLWLWPGDTTQAIQAVFTMDPGLCYDSYGGNSVEFVSTVLGTQYWVPDSIVADMDPNVCGGTVTAWFSLTARPDSFIWKGAQFRIRLFGFCPAPGGSNFKLEVLHLPTRDPACTESCALSLSCFDYFISVQCPGCVRHGTENTGYSARRKNYGLADNNDDGVAEPSGLLNYPKIATDRAMVGDTMMMTATSFVQRLTYPEAPFTDNWFKFGYYSHTIQNSACRNATTPVGALVRFYDADTTDTGCFGCSKTYQFNIDSAAVIVSGIERIFDFSFHRMPGYGVTPASDHFSYGIPNPVPGRPDTLRDSIIVMPLFKVTENIGANELICFTGPNHIYLGIDTLPGCESPASGSCEPDPGLPGIVNCAFDTIPQCDSSIQYGCTFQNGIFRIIGYEFTKYVAQAPFQTAPDNCARPIVVANNIKIGPVGFWDYFPFEYREWGISDTVSVTIPDGFFWDPGTDSVTIRESRLKGPDTIVTQTIRQIFPDGITANFSGNTVLLFNTAQYFSSPSNTSAACADDCTTNLLYPGDDDFWFSLSVYTHPTCETPADTFRLQGYIGYDSLFSADAGSVFSDSVISDQWVIYIPPAFDINPGNQVVDGVTHQVCWSGYELENTGGNASNFWMVDSSPSGNITVTDIVVDGDTVIPNSNGIFQIGSFPSSTHSAPAKSIVICAEYECSNLTEDDLYIYFGWDCPDYPVSLADYRCEPDSFILTLWPKISVLQDSVVLSSAGMNICDTMRVDVFVNSAGVGNLYDLIVQTEITGGTWIDSAWFTFPDSGVAALPVPVPVPVNDVYTWDINSLSPFIAANGLPGSGFVLDEDSTNFILSFNLVGNCDIEEVNTVITNVFGLTNCGDTASTGVITSQFTVNNYPGAVPKELILSSTNFSSCDSTATVSVQLIHLDTLMPTGAGDAFNFILPPCVEFVPGSFTGTHNPPLDGTPLQNDSLLTWYLPPGILADTDSVIRFKFKILVGTDSCGPISYLLAGNTTVPDSLFCKIDSSTGDSNYCRLNVPSAADTMRAVLPAPITPYISFTPPVCNGDSNGVATVDSIQGGNSPFSVYWATTVGDTLDTGLTVDSLPADTIFGVITDADGCTVKDTVVITGPVPLVVQTDSLSGASCLPNLGPCDGSAVVNITGGVTPYVILWSSNEAADTATGLCADTNFVTVTDSGGCIWQDTVVIAAPNSPLAIGVNISDISCFGLCDGSAVANTSGGVLPYTYSWNLPDTFISNTISSFFDSLCAGFVNVGVWDQNNCFASEAHIINEPQAIALTVTGSSDATCNQANGPCDGSAALTTSGGTPPYAYLWDDPDGQTDSSATGLCAGAYTVLVTDSNGCDTTSTVVIDEPAEIILTVSVEDGTCFGLSDGEATVTVNNGIPPYYYLWTDGQGQSTSTATGLFAGGTYSVFVTDSNGCLEQSAAIFVGPLPLNIGLSITPVSSCISFDGSATANITGGTPPYNYLWSDGQTTSMAAGLGVGPVSLTVTDANGCTAVKSGNIGSVFSVALTSTPSCSGGPTGTATATPANSTATPFAFLWSNGQTDSTATGLAPGTYSVTVTDANPCTATASVAIVDTVSYDFQSGYVVSSDTTWANVHFRINGGIYIAPGVTFTLVNSTLEFSENGYSGEPGEWGIFVDTGARLNVIHDTLTSIRSCGTTMWDGIFVKGSYWVMPAPENGLAVISGNSVVEHAHVGIQSGYSMDAKDAYAGGNIRVFSSKFLNNRRHVVIRNHFKHVNTCTFEKAEFLCTAPLLDTQKYNGEGTLHYMELARTEKMPVRGCTFKNTVLFSGIIGTGIKSWDGSFIADRTCDVVNNTTCECEGQRNRFEGLTYGIDAANSGLEAIEVDGSVFVNNRRSIFLKGVNGAKILRNSFNADFYSIFLRESHVYQIEENTFTSPGGFAFGLAVYNDVQTGYTDRFYNNTFSNLYSANVLQRENRGSAPSQGLQVKCNDYANNDFDISVTVPPGIAKQQGFQFDQESPAGNTFDTCQAPEGEIYMFNLVGDMDYYHHTDEITTPDEGCYDSVLVELFPTGFSFDSLLSCPSTDFTEPGCGGSDPAGVRQVIATNLQAADSVDRELSSLIDGGSTQGLIALVEEHKSDGQVKNALLVASPYLSDKTMLAFINENKPYSFGVVKDVIIANSPVTDTVMDALVNRKYPLPPGIMKLILAAQGGISPRALLENRLNFFLSEAALAKNELIRTFLHHDTLGTAVDSIIPILEQDTSIDAKELLVSAYLATGDTANAQILVDSLALIPEKQNFAALQQLFIDFGDTLFSVVLNDSAIKLQLEQIALDSTKAGSMQARVILEMLFGTRIPEVIVLPTQNQLKTSGQQNDGYEDSIDTFLEPAKLGQSPSEEGYTLNSYPNPYRESTIIAAYIPPHFAKSQLILFNIMGETLIKHELKQGHNFIEISSDELPLGVNFYSLISGKTRIETQKLIRVE